MEGLAAPVDGTGAAAGEADGPAGREPAAGRTDASRVPVAAAWAWAWAGGAVIAVSVAFSRGMLGAAARRRILASSARVWRTVLGSGWCSAGFVAAVAVADGAAAVDFEPFAAVVADGFGSDFALKAGLLFVSALIPVPTWKPWCRT